MTKTAVDIIVMAASAGLKALETVLAELPEHLEVAVAYIDPKKESLSRKSSENTASKHCYG